MCLLALNVVIESLIYTAFVAEQQNRQCSFGGLLRLVETCVQINVLIQM